MNVGVLDQNNPQAQAAPTIQPQGAPSFATASPEAMSQMTTEPTQPQVPTGTGLPSGSQEAQTLIKALENNARMLGARLASLSKMGQ